jgi:hypothetical protein
MYCIDEIMEMLDGNNNKEIQQNGIKLAEGIKSINAFILPLHPKCNKNVWENCARILALRSDEELSPYFTRLLEWLQDINWPGALIILERLKKVSKVNSLLFAMEYNVQKAIAYNSWEDKIWLSAVSQLLDNDKLNNALPKEILKVLRKYYHNWV